MERAHSPDKLKITDIFSVADGLPSEDEHALVEYFSHFAAPVKNDEGKPVCLNCNEVVDGFMSALGMGVAHRWALAHGEAQCSGCGWPSRGLHYIKRADGSDICSLSNVFLFYHPSNVEKRERA